MVYVCEEIPAQMYRSSKHHELKKSKLSLLEPEYKDDLISNLPDTILCHILSFLPTKYAVGTSVLSSKWKNLFPLTPNLQLEFDDSLVLHHPDGGGGGGPDSSKEEDMTAGSEPEEEHQSSFADFVGGVLKKLLQNCARIDEFKLVCKKRYRDESIVSWIRATVTLGAQSVWLNVPLSDSSKFIDSLSGCTSLTSLYLGTRSILIVSVVMFRNLKALTLDHVKFNDEESVELLFDGCPVLDILMLCHCRLIMETVRICLSSLTTLSLCGCFIQNSSTVIIDTPKLNHFFYVGILAESYSFVSKFDRICSLALEIMPIKRIMDGHAEGWDGSTYSYVKLAELINPCSGIETLILGDSAIEALHDLSLPLPKFYNLKMLKLGAMGMAGWKTLGRFLENAPNVETRILSEAFNMYDGGFASFLSSLNGVPHCLASSMKKIEIRRFKGQEDDTKLIEYFLNEGKVLEKLLINIAFDCAKHSNVLTRITVAESRSETCRVIFHN